MNWIQFQLRCPYYFHTVAFSTLETIVWYLSISALYFYQMKFSYHLFTFILAISITLFSLNVHFRCVYIRFVGELIICRNEFFLEVNCSIGFWLAVALRFLLNVWVFIKTGWTSGVPSLPSLSDLEDFSLQYLTPGTVSVSWNAKRDGSNNQPVSIGYLPWVTTAKQ